MTAFKCAILAAVLLVAGPVHAAPRPAVSIAAAVAAPGRSADNVKLDASRKPAEVLRFLGLRPGMTALDLFGGNRYWAEIMVRSVGPRGRVVVWEPSQFDSPDSDKAFAEFAAKNPNVSMVTTPFEAIALPRNAADLVMLNLNYHDAYWESSKYKIPRMNPADFLKAVYRAMKPGAVIGVIDHIANANADTRATVEKYHRIDPKVVRADFARAGFRFAGSSAILRNPADDHLSLVFDPKIRGKSDRFIYKFRKPR
ncbi:MAG: methyltransferase [Sphingomicrobium sp.]